VDTNAWNDTQGYSFVVCGDERGEPTVEVCGCHLVRSFHVLELLPIGFTQQNSCCISKFVIKTYAKTKLKIGRPLI